MTDTQVRSCSFPGHREKRERSPDLQKSKTWESTRKKQKLTDFMPVDSGFADGPDSDDDEHKRTDWPARQPSEIKVEVESSEASSSSEYSTDGQDSDDDEHKMADWPVRQPSEIKEGTSTEQKVFLNRNDLIEVKDKIECALLRSPTFQNDIIHLSMNQCSKKVDLIMDKRLKPQAEKLYQLLSSDITHVNLEWQSRTSSKIDYCFYLKPKIESGTMLESANHDHRVGAIGAILKDVNSNDTYAATCMHNISTSGGEIVSEAQPELFKYELEGSYQVVLKNQQTKIISNSCRGLTGSWRTTVHNLPGQVNIATDIAVLRLNPDLAPDDIVSSFMDDQGQTANFVFAPRISAKKLNKLYAEENVQKFGPVTGWRRSVIDDMNAMHDSRIGYIRVSDSCQHGIFGRRGDSGGAVLSVIKQPENNHGPTAEDEQQQQQQQTALPSPQRITVSSVFSAEETSYEDLEVPDYTAFGSFLGNVTVREEQKHLVTNWRHQLRAIEEVFGLQLVL